jgi:hypothetical protein
MSNRTRPVLAACLLALAYVDGGPALSDGPVYKDVERFGPPPGRHPYEAGPQVAKPYMHGRPARRVTGGPGYVGSDFGLGKPAFTGLGSRPDWGRSSD